MSVYGLVPTGPGHPQAQWRSNSYAWHTNYSADQGTNGMLRSPQKQYPVGWSAPDLGMAWHLLGQDIHRHSEDHIHIPETGTKWISKYCVYCNLDKTNAGEELSVCGWLGPLGAGPLTGTVNTIILCMKYESTLIIWAYVETKTPINKIQLGMQHLVWGRPGTLQGQDIHWHSQD